MRVTLRYYPALLLLLIAGSAHSQTTKGYWLWTVDISADNKYIATGGDDSLLQVLKNDFTVYRSARMDKQGMIRFVSWHPNENILAISSMKDTWIYNPETGTTIELEGKKSGSRTVAWNHTGELLASADHAGVVNIWNRQGKLLRQIYKTTDGKRDSKSFLGLDWHPSKDILVTVGDEIRIYDTSGNQLLMKKHREQFAGLLTAKWHPSGEFFVTGDYGHPKEGVDVYLQFWKPDGALMRTMNQSQTEFRNIRWNKQGTLLATASDALRIWNTKGDLLYTSKGGNKNGLWGVDWNSDTGRLVTVSFGKTEVIHTWTDKANWLASYQ
jgi:WD40 repeat protein